jgi:hypothetical protein
MGRWYWQQLWVLYKSRVGIVRQVYPLRLWSWCNSWDAALAPVQVAAAAAAAAGGVALYVIVCVGQ